ncbi:hypothetical protein P7L70_04715 (plasmid) [Tistrella mobilis]|uniref:hypothetical protein n=1 Tax=Tistrella mobilis TaxID=171437 RepID=UPI003555DFB2
MRGSEPAGGGGLRSYLRALLTSALIATGFIAAFNLAMDPMGEFGISGTHRLNAVVPTKVHEFRMGAVDRYLSTVIDGRADRYLIGSSRVEYGFDLCDRPDIRRIALFSFGMADARHVQARLLAAADRPLTLIMEMPGIQINAARRAQYETAPPSQAVRKLTALWSFDAVRLSMHMLHRNLTARTSTDPATARCRPMPQWVEEGQPPLPPAAREIRALSAISDTEEYDRMFRSTLADAGRVCARTGIRHRIRWLVLPISFDQATLPATRRMSEVQRMQMQMALDALRRDIAFCDITLVTAGSDGGDWENPARWLDPNHFSPTLGDPLLATVLDGQDEPD